MRNPQSQFATLIVVVAALALAAGLAIVLVTSPDSISLAPEIWFSSQSPPAAPVTIPQVAASATVANSATPTITPKAATQPTVQPTAKPTLAPTPTASPTLSVTPESALPEGVKAIAKVVLNGVAARVRDAPAGKVVGGLLKGTEVQVLQGREVLNGVAWVEIRDETGLAGWMAEGLLETVNTPTSPGLATQATAPPPTSPTPLPTLPGGVKAIAIVVLKQGTAARLRDAPAGRVIGGIAGGTQVQILDGRLVRNGVTWVQIKDDTGQTGWIAEDLIEIIATPRPG